MRKILWLNPKGGSGKTTLAITLASYYAQSGYVTTLMDHDPQGSSSYWLQHRGDLEPAIRGLAAGKNPGGVTRSFQQRSLMGAERVVLDGSAGLRGVALADLLRQTDALVVPVMPTLLDLAATADFVQELKRLQRVSVPQLRVGLVLNRVRPGVTVPDLEARLRALALPYLGYFNDAPVYLQAIGAGRGLFELDTRDALAEQQCWQALLRWLGETPA